ncbi:MAG: D-alanine--D-alanine ligase [Nitrospirota bacterium]|nr:D-alanine--D-alanine ligase [Nitrospirota bacterium]
MPKIKIALLAGGISGEREVSFKTGEQIYNALDKKKYIIYKYDPKTDLKRFFLDAINKKFNLVFPALHGPFGEDGRLQGMLDMIGVPYVFSGTLASALAMDKYKTKIIAKNAGLIVAKDIILNKPPVRGKTEYDLNQIINELSLPIVVKPVELGSSVGASIANSAKELEKGIALAFKHGGRIMLEQYIAGRELSVAVIGNEQKAEPLPVIEIIPKISSWFDYKAKYEAGGSREVCPAEIPDDIRNKAQKSAVKIFKIIGCKDVARADFIWSKKGNKIYFLEINTIPGMTQTSLVPQAAKAAGMDFSEFLDKLIKKAMIIG